MEIPRDRYLERLKRMKFKGGVKIITGMRRSGKSYLLFKIYRRYLLSEGVQEDHIIAVALDLLKNEHLRDVHKLDHEIRSRIKDDGQYYVMIDEIQLADGFVDLINGFRADSRLDVYITGSNSKFLSSDIVTEFRGRGTEIRVQPLSFSEYLPVSGLDERAAWKRYLTFGGLPEGIGPEDEDRMNYLSSLISTVYVRDIVERKGIQYPDVLNKIFDMLSSAIGSLTNPYRMQCSIHTKGLDVGWNTVSEYVGHLEDAFLFEESKRFDIRGKDYIDTPSKYYSTDLGIRNAKLGFRQDEYAHLMENAIYNELRYRGFAVDVGVIGIREYIDGKREYKQLEIDFVANKGDRRYYIQSAYHMDDDIKKEQEIRPFLKLNDGFRKLVITDDDVPCHVNSMGITVMNVIDFMKNPFSLERI